MPSPFGKGEMLTCFSTYKFISRQVALSIPKRRIVVHGWENAMESVLDVLKGLESISFSLYRKNFVKEPQFEL